MDDGKAAGSAQAPGRGGITPVPRETLHDRVYAELRRSLVHGVFVSGEMLRIQDLAEKLRTSTMPVREALARLVSEQALEALPNRSVRVPVITREKLEDLARARLTLAAAGVATTIECGPGKVLSGLNKRIDKRLNTFAIQESASLHEVATQLANGSIG